MNFKSLSADCTFQGVIVQAVEAPAADNQEKLRAWRESVNNNNCYEMAPPGFTYKDYVADCQCVSWPLFAPCFSQSEGDPQTLTSTHAENGEVLSIINFTGAVQPKALVKPIPKSVITDIEQSSTVGILRRRAPKSFEDELDSAAEWVFQAMQSFEASLASTSTASDPPLQAFMRTDACSPKDGIPPGAGPYRCTLQDARAFVDACVTSRRVVQGFRSNDLQQIPPKTAQQPMCSPSVKTLRGPWQEFQRTPLHVAYPPSSCPGSSLIIQPWSKLVRPECEFRCFVRDNAVRAVSQYLWYDHLPWLSALSPAHKHALCRSIQLFQQQWLRPRLEQAGFMLPSYVMDVVVLPLASVEEGACEYTVLPTDPGDEAGGACCPSAFGVRLLELNPFGAHLSSGAALFNWCTDTAWLYGYADELTAAAASPKETACGTQDASTKPTKPIILRWLSV